MNRNIIYMTYLLLATVIAVLLYIVLNADMSMQSIEYRVRRDTVVKTIKPEPVVITKTRTKIIKLKDTVIKTYPFRAVIDTVIRRDTVRSYFEFPSGMFSLRFTPATDTLRFSRIVLKREVKRKDEWWEKPLMIMGGVLAGYTIGRIK